MLKIITYPNLILDERIPEFDFNNPSEDPKLLEAELLETMYASNGIGLSANQVGKRVRVFVMGQKDHPEQGQAFFNPTVIANTDSLVEDSEGCLSFPDLYVKIKRPSAIKARWQNSQGEWKESELYDYTCRCFLHELDHLEGITFRDRASKIKWSMALKKLKKRKI
jgi:peptide deformylase